MEEHSKYSSFSQTIKGSLYLIAGLVLLLDRANMMQEIIHYLILIGGIALVSYGVILTRLYKIVSKLLSKGSKQTTTSIDESSE